MKNPFKKEPPREDVVAGANADLKRLADIKQRVERATPGPWEAEPHAHHASGCRCLTCMDEPTGWYVNHPDTLDCDEFVSSLGEEAKNEFNRPRGYCDEGPFLSFDDAEFAAHAREDIPWLLDALEQAHTMLYELTTVNYSYKDVVNTPLSPATIEALKARLASGDYPRRKVARTGNVVEPRRVP